MTFIYLRVDGIKKLGNNNLNTLNKLINLKFEDFQFGLGIGRSLEMASPPITCFVLYTSLKLVKYRNFGVSTTVCFQNISSTNRRRA